MKWSLIRYTARHGPCILHKGRNLALHWFAAQCGFWGVYKGREVYVHGTFDDDLGTYGLIMHPTDTDLGKIVDLDNIERL